MKKIMLMLLLLSSIMVAQDKFVGNIENIIDIEYATAGRILAIIEFNGERAVIITTINKIDKLYTGTNVYYNLKQGFYIK